MLQTMSCFYAGNASFKSWEKQMCFLPVGNRIAITKLLGIKFIDVHITIQYGVMIVSKRYNKGVCV